MGQYWRLVCLDKRQATGSYGKLGEFIFDGSSPRYIARMLTRGIYYIPDRPLSARPISEHTTNVGSVIESLPDIVLDTIMLHLPVVDVWCFALTCYRTLEIGRRNLARYFNFKEGNRVWAGCRIICVGDYIEDYPPGVLTASEEAELSEKNLFRLADDFGEDCSYEDPMSSFCERVLFSGHYGLARELLPKYKIMSQQDKSYILRNLTTKEYVRAEAFHDTLAKFNIGDLILSRICWSSDDSVAMVNNVDIHRGLWAGHRLDVSTKDTVDDTWKDATDKSYEWVKSIYENEFGKIN
ncbi:hypothetical protein BX661DRAFT_184013 [Kickxella alabastrina]|nr:uncharacterized protein BX661DRAFT_184013 [Kickxella alabastrina]KAI7826430.1 hypothetical protein BX661DRAFT_184013 [Kickxella alabastrina]